MSPQSRTDPAPRSSLSSVQVPPAKHPSQADSKHHSAHGNSQSGLAQFPDKPLVLLAWVFQYPNTPQNVLLPSNHLLEIMLHIGRLARVSFLGLLQLFQMLGQSGHMLGMVLGYRCRSY
jgi:hypothetical protein